MLFELELIGFFFNVLQMSEKKPVIGLSWEPKLATSLSGIKTKTCDKSHIQPESSLVWKTNTELVDGLFVPPNNPKKLNKLLRKQVSDTAGRSWYMPFFHEILIFSVLLLIPHTRTKWF